MVCQDLVKAKCRPNESTLWERTVEVIEIPANLDEMESDALTDLRAELAEATTSLATGTVTPEVLAVMKTYAAGIKAINESLASRQTADEQLAADTAAVLAEVGAAVPAPAAEVEVEAPAAELAAEPAKPGYTPRVTLRPSAAAMAAVAAADPAVPAKSLTTSNMVYAENVPSKSEGSEVCSLVELASALWDRHKSMRGRTTEGKIVAKVLASYDEDHKLSGNAQEDMLKLTMVDTEVTAALCAPYTPYYDLGCMSSTARPLRNALAQLQAPRGGVTIYPSPRLSDIVDGTGVWTADDDADADAVKNAAAEIACSSSTSFEIYGVYKSLRVKDMLQMTYPELVAAYMNRLSAVWARLAERQLLNAMFNAADKTLIVNSASNPIGYNGVGTFVGGLLRALNFYKEVERYEDQPFDAFVHRSVVDGILKEDDINGYSVQERDLVFSDIQGVLSDFGINLVSYIDKSDLLINEVPLDVPVNGGDLPQYPEQVDIILAPRGNFRLLDRGELNIGTANNVLRDTTTITKNEFVIFQEAFEGLVDLGCDVWHLRMDICPNGAKTPMASSAISCSAVTS